MSGDQRSDEELMRLVAGRDEDAFGLIYRRHVEDVTRVATRRCADPTEVAEVVAETFLAVWRSAGSFDPARGSSGQWIAGIAARRFLDLRRSERRRSSLRDRLAGLADEVPDGVDEVAHRIDAERAAGGLARAMRALPDRQRVVVELVDVDGLSVNDAAEALGMSPSAVSMRLTRARRALRRDRSLGTAFLSTNGGDR